MLRVVSLKRAPLHRQSGQITNGIQNYYDPMYKMFYKTKYKLYTTSLNILKCCNTFKTFHIQLGIIQLSRGEPLLFNNLREPRALSYKPVQLPTVAGHIKVTNDITTNIRY